jgi:hypothetical protein
MIDSKRAVDSELELCTLRNLPSACSCENYNVACNAKVTLQQGWSEEYSDPDYRCFGWKCFGLC